MNNKYDWIIAISNPESSDGAKIYRFRGSIDETKEKLVSLILEDKNMADEDDWYNGSERSEDINVLDNGLGYELNGYGQYQDYTIQYTAKEFAHVDFI